MYDLEFIKDKKLRKTLENSIEYILALLRQLDEKKRKQLYKEETYRVIILYITAAIEAIFLYLYKERKEKISHRFRK